ncbi:MAG: hypothetical protein WC449_02040 [Candidatus Paceibacterota bacterium]
MLPIWMYVFCVLLAVGGLLILDAKGGWRDTLAGLGLVFGIIGIIAVTLVWVGRYSLTSAAIKDAEVTAEKMLLISTRGQTTETIYDFDKLRIDKNLFDLSNPVHRELIGEIEETNAIIRMAQDAKKGPWSLFYPSFDKYPPIIEFVDDKTP